MENFAVLAGEKVRFVLSGSDGDKMSIPLPHPEILEAVTPNDDLLIDDGRVRVRVTGLVLISSMQKSSLAAPSRTARA